MRIRFPSSFDAMRTLIPERSMVDHVLLNLLLGRYSPSLPDLWCPDILTFFSSLITPPNPTVPLNLPRNLFLFRAYGLLLFAQNLQSCQAKSWSSSSSSLPAKSSNRLLTSTLFTSFAVALPISCSFWSLRTYT